MPFNRVTDVKAIVQWLLLLDKISYDEDGANPAPMITAPQKTPIYIPGLNLIPIPGDLFCNVDLAFWAAFLYVVGSVAYVVDSFFLWGQVYSDSGDDEANPAIYLNTVAAIVFVMNAVICILDWWTQVRQLSISCIALEELDITNGIVLDDFPIKQSISYFLNNLFFLAAAVMFLMQSIWFQNSMTDIYDCQESLCGSFWINFWANFLYFVSAVFAVLELYFFRQAKAKLGEPTLSLFTFDSEQIDYFGWGDIIYFITGVVATGQSFFFTFLTESDDFNGPYYLSVNILFLIDSLIYFAGYMKFVLGLRRALANGISHLEEEEKIDAITKKFMSNNVSFRESGRSSMLLKEQASMKIERRASIKLQTNVLYSGNCENIEEKQKRHSSGLEEKLIAASTPM